MYPQKVYGKIHHIIARPQKVYEKILVQKLSKQAPAATLKTKHAIFWKKGTCGNAEDGTNKKKTLHVGPQKSILENSQRYEISLSPGVLVRRKTKRLSKNETRNFQFWVDRCIYPVSKLLNQK